MDRTHALAHAVAPLAGTTLTIPHGWETLEIDTETGQPVEHKRPKRHPKRPTGSEE
jgi:hypothetical protein